MRHECGGKVLRVYSRKNEAFNRMGAALKSYDVVMYQVELRVYRTL